MFRRISSFTSLAVMAVGLCATAAAQETQLLWGDTHLHTNLSPDAYVNRNTTATPDDAYRWAKGLPVIDANSRARIRIGTPLDFLVVSDHAEYAGVPKLLWEGDEELAATATGARYIEMIGDGRGTDVFFDIIAQVNRGEANPDIYSERIRRTVWQEIVEAAERHNNPGTFTTFIGWEWSSIPDGANLHRVVFMPQGGDVGSQFIPYSAFDSERPEDLWAWLDETSAETGAEFIAIPHNSNISAGLMFQETDSDGRPITADYARTRMRWEPLVEITQIKGDSETHPTLSPEDEFADFETYAHLIKTAGAGPDSGPEITPGDYARSALMRGLEIEDRVGANPYRFGLIGSTDSHSGYSTAEEDNFWGKFSLDSIPDNRDDEEIIPGVVGWDMSASGLAAVWAEENTREAIVAAMRRREVYATTGPRIQVRLFGGWDFESEDADAFDVSAAGYAQGVPMGSDLTAAPEAGAPTFLVHAAMDPIGAKLDRIQVVKGWVDEGGAAQEHVYNVAASDGRTINPDGVVAPVGNTVDLETASYTNDIGDSQLATVWTDPNFDAELRAFYYARVLQIPTPRYSLYDAVALGIDPADVGKPATIQERAYTSPIWYTPG